MGPFFDRKNRCPGRNFGTIRAPISSPTARFPRNVQILPQPAFEETQNLDLNAARADAQSNVISSWRHWANQLFLYISWTGIFSRFRWRNTWSSGACEIDMTATETTRYAQMALVLNPVLGVFLDRKTKRSSDILIISDNKFYGGAVRDRPLEGYGS